MSTSKKRAENSEAAVDIPPSPPGSGEARRGLHGGELLREIMHAVLARQRPAAARVAGPPASGKEAS